jgi:DNA polymerase
MSRLPALPEVRREAADCTRCSLYRDATQTVFGSGPSDARLMLVGEQPGDVEDRKGEVFVGPAGHLLDRALEAAGIDREAVYLTNAVKHFKWVPRGKRRLHKRPDQSEIHACEHWLERELRIVDPELVVAMGATAASALVGPKARVTRDRGTVVHSDERAPVLLTVHPSSVLRGDPETRESLLEAFVSDLELARVWLEHP